MIAWHAPRLHVLLCLKDKGAKGKERHFKRESVPPSFADEHASKNPLFCAQLASTRGHLDKAAVDSAADQPTQPSPQVLTRILCARYVE